MTGVELADALYLAALWARAGHGTGPQEPEDGTGTDAAEAKQDADPPPRERVDDGDPRPADPERGSDPGPAPRTSGSGPRDEDTRPPDGPEEEPAPRNPSPGASPVTVEAAPDGFGDPDPEPVGVFPAGETSLPASAFLASQALTTALRPFHRTRRCGPGLEMDMEETARRYARAVLASRGGRVPAVPPVLHPPAARTTVATVAIDAGASMSLHQDVAASLLSVLRASGAFREVRDYYFDSGGTDASPPVLRDPTGAPAGPLRRREETHIGLVVTDGIGARWHGGALRSWLAETVAPTRLAIVHMLHPHQWHRTGTRTVPAILTAGPTADGRGPRAFAAPDAPELATDDRDLGSVIPVLSLHAEAVHDWAMFVMGRGAGRLAVPVLPVDPAVLPSRPPAAPDRVRPRDAAGMVKQFAQEASDTTLRLAVALAAVPAHPRVVDRVARRVLGGPGRAELAEIFFGGLVRAFRSGQGPSGPPGPEHGGKRPAWDFREGVRQELLALGRVSKIRSLVLMAARELKAEDPLFATLDRALRGRGRRPERGRDSDLWWGQVEPALTSALFTVRFPELVDFYRGSGPRAGNPGSARGNVGEEFFVGAAPSGGGAVEHRPPDRRRPETLEDGLMTRFDQRTENQQAGGLRSVMGQGRPESAAWVRVPHRNPMFVGRTGLIGILRDKILSNSQQAITALNGMSGVGKTELAKEYLHRYAGEYDLICWIPSSHDNQIRQTFSELAEQLGLGYEGAATGHVVRGVLEALRQGQPFRRWLLVFDNAETRESLNEYLPVAGSGHVIITSRNQSWSRGAAEGFLPVTVFSRDESVQLLKRRGPRELTDTDAERLAEELGDLPLALNQAAVWLNEVRMDIHEYLDRLAEKKQDMLRLLEPVDPDYPIPVAAAWNVSLDRLMRGNRAAGQLLQLCSFLDTVPVPRDLFKFGRSIDAPPELLRALGDPAQLGIAIRDIGRYSLAQIDYQQDTISLHRLVQGAVRATMSPEEQEKMRHCAHQLLAGNDPRSDSPESARQYAFLASHAWASRAWDCEDAWVRDLVVRLADHFERRGEYDEALRWGETAHAEWTERLGPDARDTLRIEIYIARSLRGKGDLGRAGDMCADTMRRIGSVLGEESPEYMVIEADHIRNLRISGDFRQSLALTKESWERRIRLFGDDDPDTLNAAHFQAFDLQLVGRLADSLELYADVWARKEQVLGAEHGMTRASIDGYAGVLMETGEYRKAREVQQHLVERSAVLLGERHKAVLSLRATLAVMVRRVGRLKEAAEISEQVLRLCRSQLGEENNNTLSAALVHSLSLYSTERYTEALELAESAGERYAKLLGAEHTNVASADVNRAIILRRLDRLVEARELDERSMLLFRDKLGVHHPTTLSCAINLANDRFRAGDVEGALASDEETLSACREVLGERHPLSILAWRNLVVGRQAGRGADRTEIDEVEQAYREVMGPDHPATLSIGNLVRGDSDIFINML
ncbi:FxSxx-COOH system tetratricopeptide repeat protein [Nocardiopsis sp. NPDC006139]|uniref:FxSxx-COOH system tetratricopeptide repeat protein n=1 Tax=Nocardiopsis sp. NPDC006139 TaxID=3154578 RepID=UPI0033A0935E